MHFQPEYLISPQNFLPNSINSKGDGSRMLPTAFKKVLLEVDEVQCMSNEPGDLTKVNSNYICTSPFTKGADMNFYIPKIFPPKEEKSLKGSLKGIARESCQEPRRCGRQD